MSRYSNNQRTEAAISRGLEPGSLGIFDPGALKLEVMEGSGSSPISEPEQAMSNEDNGVIDTQTVKDVGSYSWLAGEVKPTMIVPVYVDNVMLASPRILQFSALPFSLRPDLELSRDNPAPDDRKMMPLALLPLFRAVDAYHDGAYQWGAIDIVTDRRVMRQLLRCLKPGQTDNFRINVQLAGKRTLLMQTQDPQLTDRRISPGSYGSSFEHSQTVTAAGCENTFGAHRRVVTYKLGSLQIMVRSEVDACLPDPASTEFDPTTMPCQSFPELNIVRSTHKVPQSSIAEVKTAAKQFKKMADTFSQMYFSQMQHLFVGIHQQGRFHTIEQHQLGAGVLARCQEKAQPDLQRLNSLLRNIQSIAIKRQEPFAIIWSDGVLSIRGINSENHISMLPEELLSRFG